MQFELIGKIAAIAYPWHVEDDYSNIDNASIRTWAFQGIRVIELISYRRESIQIPYMVYLHLLLDREVMLDNYMYIMKTWGETTLNKLIEKLNLRLSKEVEVFKRL